MSTIPNPPERRMSFDEQLVESLEKQLGSRPKKDELVDRNILKDDSVAPALQAAKEKLQRSQLEDKLAHALQARPKAEELVQGGILKEEEAPASS
ncbi:hypothetical protein PILCRDRAFT_824073 [Piloderma croceum F 1598]|uniref:RPEL repeat protein n=1 Tax=Piloderma croceum (strain F 1598) TaxID=765440 RepID=A0A0C3AY62_PILCF|nr:hypothetical protein PILCRDRAFT_824073 [Piloderma croceum F 1598]